jgi:hypothetical protein
MTVSSEQPRLAHRLLSRGATMIVATAALLMANLGAFGGPPSAQAAVFDSSGYPGTASFPKITAGLGNNRAALAPNNYYLTRSPAYSGTQYVQVTVKTWGWNGQTWAHDQDYTSGVYLSAGQTAGWANFNWMYPYYHNVHAGVYVTWYNASTWRALGTRHADCTSVNDYTPTYGTQILSNSYVGAYIHYLLF